MLAAYTFGDVLWSMLIFFVWILWFWLLFTVWFDIFRRHDESGWTKAAWLIFTIILPFLGVFIYLIVENKGINERNLQRVQAQQAQMDSYIRSAAGSGSDPTAQIATAKGLLDSGAITQEEFDAIKKKALG
jgi:Short C-terminal domain/Phospholipase_D-nuclease N-terminal